MRFRGAFFLLFGLLILSGCSDSSTGPGDGGRPANLVMIGGDGQSGLAGSQLPEPLAVRVTDRSGSPVVGTSVSWQVGQGAGSLNRSSTPTDSAGEARVIWSLPVEPRDRYEVTATVSGLEAVVFTASMSSGEAGRVVASPESLTFDAVGLTATVTIKVYDPHDNEIESPVVTWSSTDTTVAVVDQAGVVTSRGGGSAMIVAKVDTARAFIPVSVDPGAAIGLQITEVAPDTLRPGQEVTITGTGFSSSAGGNTVRVAGALATVLSASSTELRVRLPESSAFSCHPTGPADVRVTVGGTTTFRSHPVRVVPQLASLSLNGYVDLGLGADRGCFELPDHGQEYLIAVYNTLPVATLTSEFRLVGRGGGDASHPHQASSPAPSVHQTLGSAPRSPLSALRAAGLVGGDRATSRSHEAHLALLEKNRELYQQLGPPPRRAPADARFRVAKAEARTMAKGDIVDLRVPDIDKNVCTDFIPVSARVVYAGPKAVVLEDTLAPLAREMDLRFELLGGEFEGTMLPVLEEYFGDPFAFDTALSNGGKILMLFSPAVNDFGGISGFVTSADFFPRTTCPASDDAQVFYAVVPTNPLSTGSGTIDQWYRSIRSTVIHEVKHIVSFGERFARNATSLEESWLEESSAGLAEEIWMRNFSKVSFRGAADYRSTIYCEVRPGWPECGQWPAALLSQFAWLYDYMSNPEDLSPLGRTKSGDGTFYGSGWHLARWAIDKYANDEAAFIKALVQEDRLSGVENLEARTGKKFEEMLGLWALGLGRVANSDVAVESWSISSIFHGLNDDFPDIFPEVYPLRERGAEFGSFMVESSGLRGGSASFIRIKGTRDGPQLIQLQGPDGGPPSSALGVAVARIK